MPPVDRFKGYTDSPDAPARNFANINPDDANDLTIVPKGLVFGTTGNCVLVGDNGNAATIPVLAGVVYPFSPQRVKSTGHTAGTVTALI